MKILLLIGLGMLIWQFLVFIVLVISGEDEDAILYSAIGVFGLVCICLRPVVKKVSQLIARKYNLSTQFGIQLDSFADFLSFVIVPTMFIFFAVIDTKEPFLSMPLIIFAFVYYVISGLRRLIQFNINADEGKVEKYFTGVPTPLGAILLWLVYLIFLTGFISETFVLLMMIVIGYLLNSKIKIPHL